MTIKRTPSKNKISRKARAITATAKGTARPAVALSTLAQRVSLGHDALTPHDVLHLQRTLGNETTQRVLAETAQREPAPAKTNTTGLPDGLKSGVENLSGIALDDVKVHYNSDQPAKYQALAYTQGSDIHVGPGQEQHLAHEAWHVIQQKQGRVASSMQFKGWGINLDPGLENEADQMGRRANDLAAAHQRLPSAAQTAYSGQQLGQAPRTVATPVQRSAVRQFVCGCGSRAPALNQVINTSAKSAPSDIAEQLTESSEAFSELRGRANEEVGRAFGRGHEVEYREKPKKGGGTGPAYYKDGITYYDPSAPMPQTVLNIVFETANAAQATKFQAVENDFNTGVLMDKPMSAYLDDPSALGKYAEDYNNPASKRSLIQEFYEWNSFLIAKRALVDLSKQYTSEVASITWETSFGAILQCNNFEEYYALSGRIHRGAVQATLERAPQKDGGSKQIDVSKLF